MKSGISVSRKKWFAVCLCREEIGIAVLDCEIACEIEQMVLWCRGLRERIAYKNWLRIELVIAAVIGLAVRSLVWFAWNCKGILVFSLCFLTST